MFCSKCGAELVEGTVFCPKCGTKVLEVQDSEEVKIDENGQSQETTKDKGNNIIGVPPLFVNSLIDCKTAITKK